MLDSRSGSPFPLFARELPLRVVLLAGFALRLFQLGTQSLWYDESVSLFIARQTVPELIVHTAGDVHPPLYYLLLHYWLQVAGTSEFAAGYFSVCFGVVLVALTYRLSQRWFGLNAGFITAIVAALSAFSLWYAQEIRMYTLAAGVATLAMLLADALLDPPVPGNWLRSAVLGVGFVACVAAGLYIHYYIAFLWAFIYSFYALRMLLGVLRSHLRRPGRRSVDETDGTAHLQSSLDYRAIVNAPLLRWTVLQLGVVLLFAPWVQTAVRQVLDPPVPSWRSSVAWTDALQETLVALAYGQSMPIATTWPTLILALLVLLVGLLGTVNWRRRPSNQNASAAWLALGAVAVPFGIIVSVTSAAPLYHVRYMFIFAAAFYVLLGAGFAAVGRLSLLLMVILLGIFAGGSLFADFQRRSDPVYAKDDYRTAVQFIAERALPGDAILIDAGYIYPAFTYYYPSQINWRGRLSEYRGDEDAKQSIVAEAGSLETSANLGWGSPSSDFYTTTERATAAGLDLLLSKHPRLWVLRANDTVNDPHGFIREYLKRNTIPFDEVTVKGESFVKAQGFIAKADKQAVIAPTTPLSVTLGQRITLLGWSGALTATTDSPLKLSLLWRASGPLDVDYHVSLGLYDGQGKRWAATDGIPVGVLLPAGEWPLGLTLPDAWNLTIPQGTPPGDYGLQVSLYDPSTNRPVPVPNGAEGTRARLGRITVVRPSAASADPGSTFADSLRDTVFDGKIALKSAQVTQGPLKPGEVVHEQFMWQAVDAPGEDLVPFTVLVDDRGRQWAIQESAPVDGRYPTSQWTAGEYVRETRDLLVPPDLPDGQYHIAAGMYRARNRERVGVRNRWWPFSSETVDLSLLVVKGREHNMRAPASVANPVRARFGDGALLVGYDVTQEAPTVNATRALTVTLLWRAQTPMKTGYTVFIHLVGANLQIVAQRDSEPGDGAFPTTGWLEGEYLEDGYRLDVRSDLPQGEYLLYTGMYERATGVRQTIFDSEGKPLGDRWLLRSLAWPK